MSLLVFSLAATEISVLVRGIAAILFEPFGFVAILFGLLSIAALSPTLYRLDRQEGRRVFLACAVPAAAAAVGVPLASVALLSGQGGPGALLFFIFIPPGLMLAVQMLLLGATVYYRTVDRRLPLLGMAGLVGAGGSPVLASMWLLLEIPSVVGPVALALGVLVLVADLAIYSHLPGRP